jgi:catechol 2,3-dioxygenase-like lactoylglutathione lyase family enzyme
MYTLTQSTVTLMIANMDKTIIFYTDGLGLTLTSRYENHYAQVSAPGLMIGLHPAGQRPEPSESISIGFGVTELADAKNRLKQMSVPFTERKEEGGRFIHFLDPDGYHLYFRKI